MPDGQEEIDQITRDVDTVIDQADELIRRSTKIRKSSQSQNEDEHSDGEFFNSEGDSVCLHEKAGPGGGPVCGTDDFWNAGRNEIGVATRTA